MSGANGGDLLSQAESDQVPSAQLDLTSVFEMGTGVTPALSLPRLYISTMLMLFNCQLRPAACKLVEFDVVAGGLFRKIHLPIPKDSIASTNTLIDQSIS